MQRAHVEIVPSFGDCFAYALSRALDEPLLFVGEGFARTDVRVCEVLDDFRNLADRADPERLWDGYQAYIGAVRAAVPEVESLRDKDRYLWARSFVRELRQDMEHRFAY